MTAPGPIVKVQTQKPTRSTPTDSGVAFFTGPSFMGSSSIPAPVMSLAQFVATYGDRQTWSLLYDAVDHYFREGGNVAYIARVVGPAPVLATKTILDASSATAFTVKAISPGVWGNSLLVAILAGTVSGYRVQVSNAGGILETSPDLTTQLDAVTWAANFSQYVSIIVGGGTVPAVHVAAALASGDDDHGNIVDAQWAAALATFTKDLGPGQVAAPGRTTDTGHTQLLDHAAAFGRVAVLDLPDTAVIADMTTSATNANSTGNAQYGASFWPWLRIPGVVANTTRVVPASGGVCGVIARNDAAFNPNVPAAGKRGQFQAVIGLSQPVTLTDAQRDTMNQGGVNVIRSMLGGFRIYGYRSLVNPVLNPNWLNFANVRYFMWLVARCLAIGENFEFDPIDGQGNLASDYGAALTALCLSDYSNKIIFGASASDAFVVDTGPSVNTPATAAANQLLGVVATRPDPMAELVGLTIVNVPVTEVV